MMTFTFFPEKKLQRYMISDVQQDSAFSFLPMVALTFVSSTVKDVIYSRIYNLFDHSIEITVWTVVHTVLTATSQSNGNGQRVFWTIVR